MIGVAARLDVANGRLRVTSGRLALMQEAASALRPLKRRDALTQVIDRLDQGAAHLGQALNGLDRSLDELRHLLFVAGHSDSPSSVGDAAEGTPRQASPGAGAAYTRGDAS